MLAEDLLRDIGDYCRQTGMAETTFGQRSVNDGKFTGRLRGGGKVTLDTLDRVKTFIRANPPAIEATTPASAPLDPEQNFRFFDNRQKYLMFVNTCSEKWVVAGRVGQELANIHPRPPAIRVFDAGVGDGTVLTRVMRSMHHRFQ